LDFLSLSNAAQHESYYADWASKKENLRRQMKLMGFSVPADW
jgi:hypothetical protein